jgi:hypothetical protein
LEVSLSLLFAEKVILCRSDKVHLQSSRQMNLLPQPDFSTCFCWCHFSTSICCNSCHVHLAPRLPQFAALLSGATGIAGFVPESIQRAFANHSAVGRPYPFRSQIILMLEVDVPVGGGPICNWLGACIILNLFEIVLLTERKL